MFSWKESYFPLMDSRPCELCNSPGKLICFCRKAILCDLCIGQHFLAEPSLSHKPISLSQSEVARVYEENIHTLHRNEERLIEEAGVRRTIARVCREKVTDSLSKIDAAVEEVHCVADRLRETLLQQVNQAVQKAESEFVAQCERHRGTLFAALKHFEGTESHADNAVVVALKDVRTVEQAQGVELIRCRVETGAVDVTEEVRKGVVASVEVIAVGKQTPQKLQDHIKRPGESKVLAKSGPGKKPLSKPVPATARPKSSYSLNTSAVVPSVPEPAIDPSKLSKRLGMLKQGRASPPPTHTVKRDVTGERRKTLFEVGPFLARPDEKGNGVKSDNEVSGEESEEEEQRPMRKFGTEAPDTHTSPRLTAKLTTLQSARAKNRQSLLQETARRVDDIAEQVKGLKTSPKTGAYQNRPFVLPEQQPDPDSDYSEERKMPVIIVTDGEKARRGSLKLGETSLTPTQQLSLAITRASEVSKALISKPDQKPSSPRTSFIPPDPSLQAYHALTNTRQLKVLSLESNNCTVRTVTLPENDTFGDEMAWCLTPANKLFLFGGKGYDGSSHKAIYEHDPVTGETEAGFVMLVGRYRHTAVFLGEGVYVAGGVGGARGAIKDCERFDPVGKTTKRVGQLAVPREGHGACSYSGGMYVAGGAQVDFVERLTVDTDVFQALHTSTVIGQSASLVAFKDRILILHQSSVSHFTPETEGFRSVGTVSERDWWSGGQAVVLSRTAYVWLGDGVYRLDGDRSQVERVEGT